MKIFNLDQHKGYFASDDDLDCFLKDLKDFVDDHGHAVLLYKGKPLMNILSNAEVVQALMRLTANERVNKDDGV